MWIDRFDPDDGAIFVRVWVYGPNGNRHARFLLDTGAQRTTVHVELTDELGYGAHMGNRRTRALGGFVSSSRIRCKRST